MFQPSNCRNKLSVGLLVGLQCLVFRAHDKSVILETSDALLKNGVSVTIIRRHSEVSFIKNVSHVVDIFNLVGFWSFSLDMLLLHHLISLLIEVLKQTLSMVDLSNLVIIRIVGNVLVNLQLLNLLPNLILVTSQILISVNHPNGRRVIFEVGTFLEELFCIFIF